MQAADGLPFFTLIRALPVLASHVPSSSCSLFLPFLLFFYFFFPLSPEGITTHTLIIRKWLLLHCTSSFLMAFLCAFWRGGWQQSDDLLFLSPLTRLISLSFPSRSISLPPPPPHPLLCLLSRKPVNMNKTPITYRQEKSNMMGSMERSFTDQSTLQEDERMALSFMDTHTCSTRSKTWHNTKKN